MNGLFSTLNRLKIRTRVMAGFGIMLLLIFAMGGKSFMGFLQAETDFGTYREAARSSSTVNGVEAAVVKTELGVKDYLGNPTESSAFAVRSRADDTLALTGEVRDAATSDADRQALSSIAGNLAAYKAEFDAVVDKQQIIDAEVSITLNGVGRAIRLTVNDIKSSMSAGGDPEALAGASDLMMRLMLVRYYVQRYLTQPSSPVEERIATEIGAFKSAAQQLQFQLPDAERQQLETVVTRFGQYEQSFALVKTAMAERDSIISDRLNPVGEALLETAQMLKAQNNAIQEQIGPELAQSFKDQELLIVIVSLVGAVAGLLTAYVIGRSIIGPVKSMTAVMNVLASGDKTVDIPATEQKDEIGEMARALETFKQNLIRNEELAEQQRIEKERREAEERETLARREKRAKRLAELTVNFDGRVQDVLARLAAASGEMDEASESMAGVASRTSTESTSVASASTQAAQNVEMVAAATEELSSSVREIAQQVGTSSQIASKAVNQAKLAESKVSGLVSTSKAIDEVVTMINDIAGQTNLLALNATIEAARAGEAGKGFAVVATEVKSLASQTSAATEDISQKVAEVQSASNEAAGVIKDIAATIVEINEIASSIASAVEEQSAATSEIARNVEEAATGTKEVSRSIVTVQEAATESGSAAEQVRSTSSELSNSAGVMRDVVDTFLSDVKAVNDDTSKAA